HTNIGMATSSPQLVMLVSCLAALALAAGAGEADGRPKARRFVTASGARFMAGGRPFYADGFNAYWLMYMASNPADRSKVLDVLDQASRLGPTVVRTWAFSDGQGSDRPLQITPGVHNEQVFVGLDFVIAEAKKRGIYLILSLVNNMDSFGGKKQYVQWARDRGHYLGSDDDFFSDALTQQFYKNHIKRMVTRVNTFTRVAYKDEPTIFAWELMNEPRVPSDLSGKTMEVALGGIDVRVRQVRRPQAHGGDRHGRVLRRVYAGAQAVQPGARVHRRHRLHLQQPHPHRRLRHHTHLPRPMVAGVEQPCAGGVHQEVDGVSHRGRGEGAAEAAAGGGVRLVRALRRLHGGGAGRLLPHGVRRHLRVGEGGRAVRRGALLACHGAWDGELDRRL
uniref:mannan endo-1,4-beta-mannosidase n=1 Tax=Aegilops tauschii subsp. strangulata TaxID=200361 RepID=A0A453PRF6_AEGTS